MRCFTHFKLLSFLAEAIPSKSPELPGEGILGAAPKLKPPRDAGFGVDPNNEV
jgi:hypothetical protein